MGVEVELIGGPADGQRRVIDADPMHPPIFITMKQAPSMREIEKLAAADPDAPVPMRTLVYARIVNPTDDGPLWHYRYEE